MQVYVQKSTRTTLPRSSAGVRGDGIQPAGRPVETREVTLDGQRGRARMAAGAEEAHVPLPPAWGTASANAGSCGRSLMPPAIIRCEYAQNFVALARAAGWCATGITFVGAEDNGVISAVS